MLQQSAPLTSHPAKFGLIGLVLFMVALLHAWLLTHVLDWSFINNGDGWRVLRSALVAKGNWAEWQPTLASYPMQSLAEANIEGYRPVSLSGYLAMGVALVSKAVGASEFPMWILTALYLALFYYGNYRLWFSLKSGPARAALATGALFFLLNPGLVAVFYSPYEEAAAVALFPLWCHLALIAQDKQGRIGRFCFLTALLIFAKPSLLPLLLAALAATIMRPGKRSMVFLALLIIFSGWVTTRAEKRYGDANAFNRLYGGLAYSTSEVSDWPEHDFLARLNNATKRVDQTQREQRQLPSSLQPGWGQHYWPFTDAMPEQQRIQMAESGKLKRFIPLILGHPSLLTDTVSQSFLTANKADYQLSYIADPAKRHEEGWHKAFALANAHLGWLFTFAALLAVFAAYRRQWVICGLLLSAALAPISVAMGDGYFEYEKHLLPYLSLILCALAPCLSLFIPAQQAKYPRTAAST